MDKYEPRPSTHPFIVVASIVSAATSLACALYILGAILMSHYSDSRSRYWGEEALEAAIVKGPISIACLLVFLVASAFGRRLRRPLTWIVPAAWFTIAAFVMVYQ